MNNAAVQQQRNHLFNNPQRNGKPFPRTTQPPAPIPDFQIQAGGGKEMVKQVFRLAGIQIVTIPLPHGNDIRHQIRRLMAGMGNTFFQRHGTYPYFVQMRNGPHFREPAGGFQHIHAAGKAVIFIHGAFQLQFRFIRLTDQAAAVIQGTKQGAHQQIGLRSIFKNHAQTVIPFFAAVIHSLSLIGYIGQHPFQQNKISLFQHIFLPIGHT